MICKECNDASENNDHEANVGRYLNWVAEMNKKHIEDMKKEKKRNPTIDKWLK